MSESGYPCIFKAQCRNCTIVDLKDRPHMCMQLKCQHFELCPGCSENRTLHDTPKGRMCKLCLSKQPTLLKKTIANKINDAKVNGTINIPTNLDGRTQREFTITPPGTPPPELLPLETQYYEQRWSEYEGFYRNPSAYFICHMMIIQEISLQYITSRLLQSRGVAEASLNQDMEMAVGMLKKLKDQLPEKEAQDVMDDEKSLAVIYQTYIKERQAFYVDGVSRILSPEAIALAPSLEFPIDAKDLLLKCGYKLQEAEFVASQVVIPPKDTSAKQLLQFFGFRLDEEYARPIASPLVNPLSDLQLAENETLLD